jgi:hypothetical protein
VRNMKMKHLGIRIDAELHAKLHYVCRYEGRSANGQILYLIRMCIAQFEKKHGKIPLPPEEEKRVPSDSQPTE